MNDESRSGLRCMYDNSSRPPGYKPIMFPCVDSIENFVSAESITQIRQNIKSKKRYSF